MALRLIEVNCEYCDEEPQTEVTIREDRIQGDFVRTSSYTIWLCWRCYNDYDYLFRPLPRYRKQRRLD